MDASTESPPASQWISRQDLVWALLLLGVGFVWFLTQREKVLAQQDLEQRSAAHRRLQKAIRAEGYDVHYSSKGNVRIERARN